MTADMNLWFNALCWRREGFFPPCFEWGVYSYSIFYSDPFLDFVNCMRSFKNTPVLKMERFGVCVWIAPALATSHLKLHDFRCVSSYFTLQKVLTAVNLDICRSLVQISPSGWSLQWRRKWRWSLPWCCSAAGRTTTGPWVTHAATLAAVKHPWIV